jgi:hypothetical protein
VCVGAPGMWNRYPSRRFAADSTVDQIRTRPRSSDTQGIWPNRALRVRTRPLAAGPVGPLRGNPVGPLPGMSGRLGLDVGVHSKVYRRSHDHE